MAADYDVGNRRPPVAHRFKKGQSGNPSGRPKGAKSEKVVFLEIAKRKVRIREGGKVKYLTQLEVMLQAMALKAMKGDSKAADTFHKIGKSLGVFDPNPPEPGRHGVIILPATMSPEDWEREVAKYYAKCEEEDLKKAQASPVASSA
jgi:hypothetical protein